MISIALTLSAVIAALVYYFYCSVGDRSASINLPPVAPRFALPIVGHLHLFGFNNNSPHVSLLRWSKTYGKVFFANLGQYKVLVINGHKEIQLVLNDNKISGRPDFPLLDIFTNGPNGIQNNGTSSWGELRRFAFNNLKGLGMGRGSFTLAIQSEVTSLQDKLSRNSGPTDIIDDIFEAIGNSIWEIAAGQRLEDDSIWKTLKRISGCINKIGLAGYTPKYTKWLLGSWKDLRGLAEKLNDFQQSQIREHVKNLDSDDPSDFIDFAIKENSIRHQDLVAMLNDIVIGGCLPTAWTLVWGILFLSKNTEVQEELQREIDSVLGTTLPTMEARPKMPFAIATLMETLRKSSFYPLGIFHAATEETTILGYKIPKETIVCTNLYSAHHDPEVWGDPESFRPSRFIQTDEAGRRKLLRHEASLPFSFGKRSCIGELMAKELLFLYLTSLFQRFSFKMFSSDELSGTNLYRSFLSIPPNFKVIVKER